MSYIHQWLEDNLHISHSLENKILSTLFIVILLFLIQALTLKIAQEKVESHKARYIWQKAFGYITTFIAVILLGNIWINDIKSLQTVVGLFSAGVAFVEAAIRSKDSGEFKPVVEIANPDNEVTGK